MAKQNRKAIKESIGYINAAQEQWTAVQNITNEKFFIVGKEIHELRKASEHLMDIQSQNAKTLQKQFQVLTGSIHLMRNCDQLLYVRGETNHHLSLLNSILGSVYTNLRSYRNSVYAFKMNLFTASPAIAEGMLPLSLIPKRVLAEILQSFVIRSQFTASRLTLSIPIANIMSYYETKLVSNVISTDFGLMFTLSIRFSSGETVLDVFHAIPLPMPTTDSIRATMWDLETEYIAVTENQNEAALLTAFDLEECIGSKSYSICFSSFHMEKSKDSCLATLLFKDSLSALEVCRIRNVQLPLKEKAQSLGHGRWLITSTSEDFILSTTASNSTHPLNKEHRSGCKVCIVILSCGQELEGPNIHLRADWSTCENTEPTVLDLALPFPLAFLFNKLPPIDDMPQIKDVDMARTHLIEQVQLQLVQVPQHKKRSLDAIEDITQPILTNMKKFHPQLDAKFDNTVSWTPYLVFGAVIFVTSFLLHLLMSYLFHRYQEVHKRFPFRLQIDKTTIKSKPIIIVSDADFEYLKNHHDHRLLKKGVVVALSQLQTQLLSLNPNDPSANNNIPKVSPEKLGGIYPTLGDSHL